MTTGTAVPEMWSRALTDPELRDLPFKVETNEYGQLVLSPHKVRHSLQQGTLVRLLLEHLPTGTSATEFAVLTPKGVKVPDVIWISDRRLSEMGEDPEASAIMPEIVVEVLSKSNTVREIDEKRELYLAGGAREVWTCATDGRLTFYNAGGTIPTSTLVPTFPVQLPDPRNRA